MPFRAIYNVSANEILPENVDTFEKDGNSYILKTYILEKDNDIMNVAGESFEQDGFLYYKSNIESMPLEDIEKKTAELIEKIKVFSKNSNDVLSRLPVQKEYSDKEGFSGILFPVPTEITFKISDYTTKTYTKNDIKYYYNLPSMDIGNINEVINSGGINMTITDINWICSNNLDSGNTAVGNNYTAKVSYSGTYNKKIPSSYIADVVYRGEVQKTVSNKVKYIVTYEGKQVNIPKIEDINISEIEQKESLEQKKIDITMLFVISLYICSFLSIFVYFIIKNFYSNKNDF